MALLTPLGGMYERVEIIMKNRLIYGAVTGILTAVLFTGCGDGSEISPQDKLDDVLEPVTLAVTPEPASGEDSEETDGISEAEENSRPNSGLEDLSPEVAAVVLENLQNLLQNLELPEYVGEAVHLVSSEEWFAAVAVELIEGSRSYTIGGAGDASLSVQVGYDTEEKPYVNTCYQADGQILMLTYAKEAARLLQTGISEGVYNGAFEKWQINGGTGYILKETGTYVNGIIVGQYVKAEYTGGPGDVFDLWTNRDNFEYKTTEMNYNEKGQVVPSSSALPSATPKPESTNKPVQTTKPAVTPTAKPPQPTAKPTQAPPQPTQAPPQPTAEPPQPTQAPPEPTAEPPQPTQAPPEPTAEPPQPTQEPPLPPGGGDTDIEWSPDIM